MRLLSICTTALSAFVFASSTSTTAPEAVVIANPSFPSARYTVMNVLGEGRWGIVHRVRMIDGSDVAMKSDKVPVRLSDGDTERDVLEQIQGLDFVGPQLIDSFAITTEAGNGRRYTVMQLVGVSIKQYMATSHLAGLHERTASSIMLQIVDAASQLRTAGFLHNDIHYDNVAFATPTSQDRTLLIDFGNAKPVPANVVPNFINQEFGIERVLNDFVLPAYHDTDRQWFHWMMSQTSNDKPMLDFINRRPWSAVAKMYIRNARIVARMQNGSRHSSVPLSDSVNELISAVVVPADSSVSVSWFTWALQQEEHHINSYLEARTDRFDPAMYQLITGTRALAGFIASDLTIRKDFARMVKCFLQMIGCARDTDGEVADSWFWSLMTGRRDLIAASFTCHSNTALEALDLAWDVMHGSAPDLAQLRQIFENYLAQNGFQYTGIVLF